MQPHLSCAWGLSLRDFGEHNSPGCRTCSLGLSNSSDWDLLGREGMAAVCRQGQRDVPGMCRGWQHLSGNNLLALRFGPDVTGVGRKLSAL